MYKPELQEAIVKRLQQFLQEEVGNRVTVNNMTGLSVAIGQVMEAHKVKEPDSKKEDKPK